MRLNTQQPLAWRIDILYPEDASVSAKGRSHGLSNRNSRMKIFAALRLCLADFYGSEAILRRFLAVTVVDKKAASLPAMEPWEDLTYVGKAHLGPLSFLGSIVIADI